MNLEPENLQANRNEDRLMWLGWSVVFMAILGLVLRSLGK